MRPAGLFVLRILDQRRIANACPAQFDAYFVLRILDQRRIANACPAQFDGKRQTEPDMAGKLKY